MSELTKIIGQRVRNYRTEKGLSQEKLAELSGCHPTYIGQVERGEKNATLDSIEKIASAMGVSLSKLFEKIGEGSADSYPMRCYELVAAKSKSEQEHLYKMLGCVSKVTNRENYASQRKAAAKWRKARYLQASFSKRIAILRQSLILIKKHSTRCLSL